MQIDEQSFREAVAGTKKDAKLVAAARNDRTSTAETMFAEYSRLPVERQRDILIAIAVDHFVAAQWKIAFPLNNFPAAVLPQAVRAVGKALFFTRDEDSVREYVRAIKIYQDSPFIQQIADILTEALEVTASGHSRIAEILTAPEVFAIMKALDPEAPASEKIVRTIGTVATFTKDLKGTCRAAQFLFARKESKNLDALAQIVETSIFHARDRYSVEAIITGLNAGGIDAVLQQKDGNRRVLADITQVAARSRDWKTIRNYLLSL